MPDFIKKIDWPLLDKQKHTLLRLRNRNETILEEDEALTGIIHLIDAIQDYAVDECGMDENYIFSSLKHGS